MRKDKLDEAILDYAIERVLEDPQGYDPMSDERIPQEVRARVAYYIEPVRQMASMPLPRPRAAAVHMARERMRAALARQRSSSSWHRVWDVVRGLVPRRTLAPLSTAFTVVLLLLFVGVGTYVLAMNAVPGHPLYAVKRQIETLSLHVVSVKQSPLVHMDLALRRLNEYARLLRRGEPMPNLLEAYVDEVDMAYRAYTALPAEEQQAVRSALRDKLQKARALLRDIATEVPADSRPLWDRAWDRTEAFLQALGSITPFSGAPTTTPTPTPSPTCPPTGTGMGVSTPTA